MILDVYILISFGGKVASNLSEIGQRNYFNLLIMIEAMRQATGHIDAQTFPQAVERYARELKKVRINLAVDENSVRKAIDAAVEDKILGMPKDNNYQFPIVGDAEEHIRPYNFLTDEEISLAKAAARVTKKAYIWGNLDKDL